MKMYATKLRVLRAEHNMTQEDLAKQVGVVRQTIAYLEKGEYMPSLGLAWKISQIFNLPIEEVFIFEQRKNKDEISR
jgi:putative transcriptional regulator